MRLGMCGCFLPENMNDFTPDICRRVRDLGFSGIFCRFRQNDPHSTTRAEAQRLRSLLADENLRLFQATGYGETSSQMMRPASRKRAHPAGGATPGRLARRPWHRYGPGSMSPAGPWAPHPANWTRSARRQLIRSLRECAAAAEDAGVYLSVEAHQTVTLASPEIAADVLDAVDSPWVASNMTPLTGSISTTPGKRRPPSTTISTCWVSTSSVATPRTSSSKIASS